MKNQMLPTGTVQKILKMFNSEVWVLKKMLVFCKNTGVDLRYWDLRDILKQDETVEAICVNLIAR